MDRFKGGIPKTALRTKYNVITAKTVWCVLPHQHSTTLWKPIFKVNIVSGRVAPTEGIVSDREYGYKIYQRSDWKWDLVDFHVGKDDVASDNLLFGNYFHAWAR